MALIYCGIDEAGYGPMLGPLCVGLSAFRVPDWEPGENAPDLWDLLRAGACRSLKELRTDRRGRVVIADSKQIKLSNQLKTKHPLVHLERAALSLLGAAGVEPADDVHLFAALGAALPDEPWYSGEPTSLPVGSSEAETAIARNVLGCAAHDANVGVLEIACRVVGESRFNAIVRDRGSKTEATIEAIGGHLRTIRDRWGGGVEAVRIVCDRLGARAGYFDVLERELPGSKPEVVSESPEHSVYRLAGWPCDARVSFQTEAETAHLPVAAASIVAKLVRELAMARFNRHFSGRVPQLKPTAGYYADARRWLSDAEPALAPEIRRRLVRLS